jgi:hypothetical protein
MYGIHCISLPSSHVFQPFQSNVVNTGGVAGAFTGGFRQSGHLLVTRYRAGKATVSVASQQV